MKQQPPRSIILETSVHAIFPTALLFSVFLLFAGHNAPGGGFVGGLVAGAAVVLRYVEGGSDALRRTLPVAPTTMLGSGLAIALTTAVAPLLAGKELLESGKLSLEVPLVGTVKATSALPFDIGVYLVVLGLVLTVLRTLGEEDPA